MLTLRPHHLVDIVADFDPARMPQPDESGNAVHLVTAAVAEDLDQPVRFVLGADDICVPCRYLRPDGTCRRILEHHDPPETMDEYNDPLDERLFAFLGIERGGTMAIREFLARVNEHIPGIEQVCTSPVQDPREKLAGIIRGLTALGIRRRD